MKDVEFKIIEHIGTISTITNREELWTTEINVVSWNDGKPKVDVREWNECHDRMSRGLTLTEEQALTLAEILIRRYGGNDKNES